MHLHTRKATSIAVSTLLIIMATANMITAVTGTWKVNIIRLTTAPTFDGNPSIIQTSDSRIWIVWAKAMSGDNTIFCKTSSDLGLTWSDEENLTYISPHVLSAHDESPSIIQAANGTIWLVYSSNKPPPRKDFAIDASPKALTIPQGGFNTSTISIYSLMSFSEAVTLSSKLIPLEGTATDGINTTYDPNPVTPPANDIVTSTLTVTANATANPGNYSLNVMGTSGDITHHAAISLEVTESGAAGSNTASISNMSSSFVSLSSAESQVDADVEIYYKTSNDNGATWSKRTQLTNNSADDLSPSIVQLANGTIMIVYGLNQGFPVTSSNIFYNATSDGVTWTYGNITAYSGFERGPCIMQAEDEKIWVAWASNRTGDVEIFSKTYNGSWSNATQITNSTDIDSCPSLIQTYDDRIWLFWQSSQNKPTVPPGDIYYKFSTDNGVTWSDRTQFTTDNESDVWPAVTQTRDTTIWVAWTSNRADQPDGNWDIYYRQSFVGDVNEDGVVNILDLAVCAQAYGAQEGDPKYDPYLDLNGDGWIDMRDLSIIARNYGKTA